nr:hypothetical protein [Tanacetum cinerariifolium]
MVTPNNLGPDLAGKPVNKTSYRGMIGSLMYLTATSPDYVGCNMDRKSTIGACQILDGKLVCWSAKKQQSVAISSAEAEYVESAGGCASILWIKGQLGDNDIHYKMVSSSFEAVPLKPQGPVTGESDDEEVFVAGKYMDEDTQADEEVHLTKLLTLIKNLDFQGLKSSVEYL